MNRKIFLTILFLFLFVTSCSTGLEHQSISTEATETQENPTILRFFTPIPQATSYSIIFPKKPVTEISPSDYSDFFIVITINENEQSIASYTLYLCSSDKCSTIYQGEKPVSSATFVPANNGVKLLLSLNQPDGISVYSIDLKNPNQRVTISSDGYNYFQDFNGDMLLLTNLTLEGQESSNAYLFDMNLNEMISLEIPCIVKKARFGFSDNQILFTGVCDSKSALFSFDSSSGHIESYLDLPAEDFSVSPDRSYLVYNTYLGHTAKMELISIDHNQTINNDQIKIKDSSFTKWIGSDKLVFTQKKAGNEALFYIWDYRSNSVALLDLPSHVIAFYGGLGSYIYLSNSNQLMIHNIATGNATRIPIPTDQRIIMAYPIEYAQ